MKWVTDKTGRFPKRPHYAPGELDNECERMVEDLLRQRQGAVRYPVTTDDLLFGLEQHAIVDHFAELPSASSGDIWGVTNFSKHNLPEVRINRCLSPNPHLENPYRTTITHETAHVRFHGVLFSMYDQSPGLFQNEVRRSQSCNRQQVESSAPYDWIEWQAAYCSGALLMPINALRGVVIAFLREHSVPVSKLSPSSKEGAELVEEVIVRFQVSSLAAKVRLGKLGFLADSQVLQPSLLT